MTEQARVLVVGGSGFLSGSLARRAAAQGHQVWAVTRGRRPLPEGVTGLTGDRKDRETFEKAVADAGTGFDLVVDYIGYDPEDAQTDIAVIPLPHPTPRLRLHRLRLRPRPPAVPPARRDRPLHL